MTKEAQKIEKERLERLKKRTKNQSGDDREEERAHIILEESKDTTVQVSSMNQFWWVWLIRCVAVHC